MFKKIISLLSNFIKYTLTKKSFWLPGTIIMTLLFAISNIINFSLSYMGNTNEDVASFVIKNFWLMILFQILKVLAIYLIIGIFFNIFYLKSFNYINQRWKIFKSKQLRITLTSSLLFTSIILFFLKTLIIFPQLFMENFSRHAAFLQAFQYFATDNLSPVLFNVLLIILNLPFILIAGYLITQKIIVNLKKINFSKVNINLRKYRYAIPVIIAAIILLIIFISCNLSPGSQSDQKNILIISSDAVRPDRLSCNGYKRKTTPFLDNMLKEGVQFRNVFTTVPRTLPSWVSMLSSQTPLTHEIKHMFPRTRERSEKIYTAVNRLKEAGYVSAIISDYAGETFPRLDLGFDKVLAPDLNLNVLIKQIILEKQIFLFPFITNKIGQLLFPEIRGLAKYANPTIITEELFDEINAAGNKPFFITIFYSITHFPFAAPYPYYNKYTDPDYNGPYKYFKQIVLNLGADNASGKFEGTKEVPLKDKQQINDLYDGCLNLFDLKLNKIINYLKGKDLYKNTIILIYADHGENIYDYDFGIGHGEHLKGNAALEVPCIIFADNLKEHQGKTYFKPASQIDIMPTLLELANISIPEIFRGESLFTKKSRDVDAYLETGLWFDNSKKTNLFFQNQRIDYPDVSVISEIDTNFNNEIVIKQKYQNITNGSKYRAIYSGAYKLIYMPMQNSIRYELYNHITDPHNQNNLTLKKPLILKAMQKKFFDYVIKESAGNFININGYLIPAFSDPIF